MSKKVLLLFQDCIYCKPHERWMQRQANLAKEHNIEIVETPFTVPGAKELIKEADRKGFESLPFFTDGLGKFSRNLADFLEVAETPVMRPVKRKKSHKKVKERTDEAVPVE